MPSSPSPTEVLRRNHEAAQRLVAGVSKARTLELLKTAQLGLERRLRTAEGLGGPGRGSFTAVQLRATLAQVRAVLAPLQIGMRGVVLEQGKEAAAQAATGAARYLRSAEQRFKGLGSQRLALDQTRLVDRAVAGTESSVLSRLLGRQHEGKKAGILQRYGHNVVGHFEDILQQRLIQKTPWEEVKSQLIEKSEFLQGAPAHWAERIVRTEVANQAGRASQESIVQADQTLGDMCKILSTTFDARTGCLVGSTPVTGAVIRAIFRRRYEGQMVRFVTKSGRDFTTTPNHPMLTRRGWVHANVLDLSDYLVCDGGKEHASATGYQHVTDGPVAIAQLFESAQLAFGVERHRGTKPDFHGDGMDGEVDVVRTRGLLGLRGLTPLFEPHTQGVFTPTRDPHRCPNCSAVLGAGVGELLDGLGVVPGCQSLLLESQGHSALRGAEVLCDALQRFTSLVASHDQFGVEIRAESRVLELLIAQVLGCRIGSGDTELSERLVDVAAMCGHRCRDLSAGHAAPIEFDQVVEIQVTRFNGHVFNLSTTDGYFTIDDAYTSNSDSYAVHGQIRRPNESFDSWFGSFMHPPDRPNDRGIVVPHRISWPIPAELKPKGAGAMASRWAAEGRKGGPPSMPLQTTIPLDQFGKQQPPPVQPENPGSQVQDVLQRAPERPPRA